MKRYKINNSLRDSILKCGQTIRSLNKIFGFEIRNVLYKSSSINEFQLKKLEDYFRRKFNLKRVYLYYGKNLGLPPTTPIRKIRPSKKLAEFIGIMLGDGNIWRNRIRIAFDKRNTNYIIYVSRLITAIFGIKSKKEILERTNQAYLYFTNLFAVEKLIHLGLIAGNKIENSLGIPRWIKENKAYSKACIRGLIDTDGCIYKCKREKQIYIKFTNFNKQLLRDFREITLELKYPFAKANKNNLCLYRKNEVVRFIKDIKPLKSMNGAVG